jgi:predicted ATPase
MNSILKKFSISKLYGERDVAIDFSSNIKILVAENGYGKTTILNALFGVLSGDISKLRQIDFENISIEFNDGESFVIDNTELKISTETFKKNGIYDHLVRKVGETKILRLLEEYFSLSPKQFYRSVILKSVASRTDIPASHLINILKDISSSKNDFTNFIEGREKLKEIRKKFDFNIVYLPTYRRVEQDFEELTNTNDIEFLDDHSINFGMKDVTRRFEEITKEIIASSVAWFSKVNGQMLSQLIEGFKVDDEVKNSINEPDALKIVLDRIGDNIEESYKRKIIKLVETKEIFEGHDPLLYFISNLMKVYGQQKSNDQAIQEFSDVCNRYLVDKKVNYNESNVTIDIVRRKNGKPVDIENLSSGEKQIISLFARLYLKRENNLAIFFDEPELSLSLEWQKTLLPDILNSGKCSFLFTTTHSPFIFENELAEHTVDLGHYIKEL